MASQIENFYQNEYKALQTQNTLLIHENNALKNKCAQLEIELKYTSDSLLKFQNCDFNKLLRQKETIIDLLQNVFCAGIRCDLQCLVNVSLAQLLTGNRLAIDSVIIIFYKILFEPSFTNDLELFAPHGALPYGGI